MNALNAMTKTVLFIGVAAAMCGLAMVSAPSIDAPELYDDSGDEFFPTFTDPDQAVALEVVEWSADTAEIRPFRVEKKEGRWTIPSHHGYAADAKDQMAKSAGMLIGLLKDGVRSDRTEDHGEFGVLDPKDAAADLEGRGTRVAFEDDSGNGLASLIIGNEVEGRDGMRYVRVPEKKRTYVAKLPTTPSTTFEEWIETDLLGVTANDIEEIVIDRYSIDEQTFSRMPGEISTLAKKDFDWTLDGLSEETEELNEDKISDVTSELAALKIVGVREKPAGLTQNLRQAEGIQLNAQTVLSLQGRGFFVTNDGHLFANEGDLISKTKKGVAYTLRFGEVLYGSGEALTSGAENEGGAGEAEGVENIDANRFLMVTALFDESILDQPEGTPLAAEDHTKRTMTRTAIEAIVGAVDKYKQANETLPESLAALTEGDAPILPSVAKDSWENDFVLHVTEDSFSVASLGADGQEGGEGLAHDISSDDWAYEDALRKTIDDHAAFATKVTEGKAEAKKLMDRFAPWYYVISDESFKKLRPPRTDLVTAKEAEETEGADDLGDLTDDPIGG